MTYCRVCKEHGVVNNERQNLKMHLIPVLRLESLVLHHCRYFLPSARPAKAISSHLSINNKISLADNFPNFTSYTMA